MIGVTMIDSLTKNIDFPSRILMASIFLLSGFGKIGNFAATQSYMQAVGLPGFLLAPTIAFEMGTGLLLIIGLGTRHVAFLLAGFCVVTAFFFHRDFGDQVQQIMFLKNLVMAGGFLLLAKYGAPSLSVDRLVTDRRRLGETE